MTVIELIESICEESLIRFRLRGMIYMEDNIIIEYNLENLWNELNTRYNKRIWYLVFNIELI